MSDRATYYGSDREAEDAMAVMARWISRNRKIKVVYHSGTAVDADVEGGVIRIPRMACASGITQEALMLLRGRVYHEAGHIDETVTVPRKDYPKPTPDGRKTPLFEIWNALEDRRMEAVESDKHAGCKVVFDWSNKYFNKEIAKKISSGNLDAPLWEALVAMSFLVEGCSPAWSPSKKAKAYIDVAYGEFSKVKSCQNDRESLELAEKIHKLLKQANEDWKKNEPKQQPQKGQQGQKGEKGEKDDQGDQGEQEKGKQDKGEPQSGGSGDFEDEDEEGEGKDSESKKSKNGKDDKGEKKDGEDGEEDGEGKGGEKKEKEEKGKDGEGSSGGEEGDDEDDEEGEGEGSEGEGEEGDGEGEDEEGEGKGDGSSEGGENSEGGEKGAEAGGKGEGKGGNEGDGEKPDGKGESKGDVKPGDAPYEMKDEEAQGGMGAKDDRELEDEVDGVSQEEIANEELSRYFADLDPADTNYLSRRDLDEHIVPSVNDAGKTTYKERREMVSVMVASMTHALEQALRSLARSRKKPYLRHGKLDKRRLVSIAKGLSKEVFYKINSGMDLDVAVAVTIDESGSMGNFVHVQLMALAIGEALNAIRVPFEIIGTTTQYSGGDHRMPLMEGFSRVNPIIYRHYKSFNEKWDVVRSRIVQTSHYNHNIDGEVVEYAAFRLAQRKESRKIVFSLSDGEPCGGHNNDEQMGANLKRVCKRVRKEGIEVYSVSIGTEAPALLYGKQFSIVVDSVVKMGPDVVRFFTTVLTQGRFTA